MGEAVEDRLSNHVSPALREAQGAPPSPYMSLYVCGHNNVWLYELLWGDSSRETKGGVQC